MQPLGVRYAVPVDLAAVHAVTHSAYRHYVDRIGARPAPMDADYPHLMRRGCLFVVGNPAIATVTLVPEDGWLHLDNFAVAPDRQGRGLGRRVLAFAEEHARQLWLPELRLLTHAMMWENQRMYTAAGYREYTRTRPAPDQELIHYRKVIAGWDFSGTTYLPTAGGIALAGAR
ncbi:ribosomal protein S18 acetylase RimI-like enzyme [Catenulispora sp. EB89]|uniref:GNAT family N-acetyltransferase n=1 Tax=Catenulispora sp. EB89 TaxID=3156257 RepID=UPI00351310E4